MKIFRYMGFTLVISAVQMQSANAETPQKFEDEGEEVMDDSNPNWASTKGPDLETEQWERREVSKSALLMSLGEGAAWNSIGIRGIYWLVPNVAVSGILGTGRFYQKGESGSQNQLTNTQNLGFRTQWWMLKNFPFALMADVGLHKWTIKNTCLTTESAKTCTGGKMNAVGGSYSAGIMLSWLAEDDIIVEWTVLGIKSSKAWKSSSDVTSGSSADRESQDIIGKPALLNIANFALGIRF